MTSLGTQFGAARATDHRIMAEQLRVTATKLKTAEARDKLLRLASLYEELSVYYQEESDGDFERH